LASRMRVVSRLLTSATHDLMSPLNALVVNAELLRQITAADQGVSAETRERQNRCCQNLSQQLTRLSQSIRTVLGQAHAPDGEIDLCDLASLARDAVTLIAPLAQQQRTALELRSPSKEVPIVAERHLMNLAIQDSVIGFLASQPG